ncbi:MAG: hypothetical protein E7609_03085 [Ruminococcaceae bacterium]|nr:hypothetical protein [Oscillospiraceae bacterium]
MPKYRIAELLVEIEARYPLTASTCRDYLVETEDVSDFRVSVDDSELADIMRENPSFSSAYAESFAIFRCVANEAASRGAILFHAAVVEVDGAAYAFAAPSGTGKSTHIALWRKCFGKRVNIINGDKPFLRIKDGVVTAYGSPFCGKEGWQRNVSAPLKGLCFLSRGEQNEILSVAQKELLPRVFAQMLKPPTAQGVSETLRLADTLIKQVPIYHLFCNISSEAAALSFRTMTGIDISLDQ